MKQLSLTGNDIALSEQAVAMLIQWWRDESIPSTYQRKQIAALVALKRKLTAISDYAYPYQDSDYMPLDIGDEPIMAIDDEVAERTRREAEARMTPVATPQKRQRRA